MYFSIIIPTKNRPELLKEAVNSVLKQDDYLKEIIIIDDASDHIYIEELEQLSWKPKIYLIRLNESKERSYCRNLGITKSTGDYIIFLDDDDWLEENALLHHYNNFKDSNCDVSNCLGKLCIYPNRDKQITLVRKFHFQHRKMELSDYPFLHLLIFYSMLHTFAIKKTILEHTFFDEQLNYGEDLDLLLKLALIKEIKFSHINFVGVAYRITESKYPDLEKFAGLLSTFIQARNLTAREKFVLHLRLSQTKYWQKEYRSSLVDLSKCSYYFLKSANKLSIILAIYKRKKFNGKLNKIIQSLKHN